ncbi:MAG: hypothetical protein ABIB71_09780 [Candidatus Woesearchaeota archaeon]
MKGGVFLLFLSMLCSKFVAAQEIIIGEKSYPLTILIPLIAIALIWAVIMVAYLLRNFQKFSWLLIKVNHYIQKSGFHRMPIYLRSLLKKKGQEEVEKKCTKENKKDLTPYLKRLNLLEAKLPKVSNSNALHEFSEITNDFFSDLLGLRHAFTIDEVQSKLKAKRKDLIQIAERVSEAKYSGAEITKEETIVMMDKLRKVIESYVRKGWRKEHGTEKFIAKLVEEDKKIIGNIKQYVSALKHENKKQQIQEMLDDERMLLKRNISTIRKTYNRILKYYVQLSPKEREKIYPELMDFYNNVNKAMFSTVYGEKSIRKLDYFSKKLEDLKHQPKMVPLGIRLRKMLNLGAERPEHPLMKLKGMPVKAVKPKPVKLTKNIEELKKKEAKVFSKFGNILQKDRLEEKRRVDLKEAIRMRKVRLAKKESEVLEKINRITSAPPPMERVDYKAKVNLLIQKATRAINMGQAGQAEGLYSKIKPFYVSLGEVEKKVLYPRIALLHGNIARLKQLSAPVVQKSVKAKRPKRTAKKVAPPEEIVSEEDRLAYEEKSLIDKLNQLRRGL